VRIECRPSTDVLPVATGAVAGVGGVVTDIDVVEVLPRQTVVDLTLLAHDPEHVEEIERALEGVGHHVRHTSDRVFLHHVGGKIDVVPRTPLRSRDDLSVAYTPGVARVSMAIANDPAAAWNLTGKANSVAILTNGTAVLGLGEVGLLAALPVMEGKAVLFRHFAGVNAFPLVVDARSADDLVRLGVALAPGFGGINLEDIASPTCFEVERRLDAELDVPVFHDDQHGTAIVVLAALRNACAATDRRLPDVHAVVVGIGAAGTAITEILLDAGVTDVVAVDRHGMLGRTDDATWPTRSTTPSSSPACSAAPSTPGPGGSPPRCGRRPPRRWPAWSPRPNGASGSSSRRSSTPASTPPWPPPWPGRPDRRADRPLRIAYRYARCMPQLVTAWATTSSRPSTS
jgi:malate dehydrogenase (oxaloacetate-decarboxylating)